MTLPLQEPFSYRVLLSGGMDSAVALANSVYMHGHQVDAVFFDYGQRAIRQEREAARFLARHYRVKLHERPLSLMGESSITGKGSLEDDSVIVPGRNLAMLEAAAAIFPYPGEVVIAVCEDDGLLFEDCRPEFYRNLNETLRSNGAHWRVSTPFVYFAKSLIFQWAKRFGGTAILQHTWSCYEGESDAPCGMCLSCEEQVEARLGTYGGY